MVPIAPYSRTIYRSMEILVAYGNVRFKKKSGMEDVMKVKKKLIPQVK